MFPPCFDSKEDYEAWVKLAEEDPELEEPRLSFCVDCTKSFQARIKKEGRCMFPWLEVIEEKDGD